MRGKAKKAKAWIFSLLLTPHSLLKKIESSDVTDR